MTFPGRASTGRTILAAVVLALAGAAAWVPVHRLTEGPPPGFTGGFGEQSCLACHIGNDVNAFDGRVYLNGLPDAWEPGTTYALEVMLEAEETALAGFQMTARFAEGEKRGHDAGVLGPGDARSEVTDSAGVHNLQQSAAGAATSDRSGSRWTLSWIAPEVSGSVALNVAANSGNGDDSPLGDLVYVFEAIVPAAR
jgi:hypothetical protein